MTEVTPRSDNALTVYRSDLIQYEPEFAKVLPAHMSPQRLTRMAESAARLNPKLLSCNRGSLMRSIFTGAVLGLEIDGVTGQAFLVPYKDQVQLQIGYKGYVTLAMNSGYLLRGRVVRAKDVFAWHEGINPGIAHEYPSPMATREQRGDVIGAYAIASHLNHNLSTFKVVTIDEILASREKSQAYKYAVQTGKNDTPWKTNFEEMAAKTAIRALADQLPLNVQRALAFERTQEETGTPTYLDRNENIRTPGDDPEDADFLPITERPV